jgi:hypothetical protein
MYDNPSDIEDTFSKRESPIVVQQCRMPRRQTVCRTAKTLRKTHRVIDPLSIRNKQDFSNILHFSVNFYGAGMILRDVFLFFILILEFLVRF